VFKNTVKYYTSRNSNVFTCFVDFKVFDNVDFWLLFCKMYDVFHDTMMTVNLNVLYDC